MSRWFSVKAIDDEGEISIFDEIGGWGIGIKEFKEAFDLIKNQKRVRLFINSPGGEIIVGMAIYNLLQTIREKLTVEILGMAASMASIVALAGKSLIMDENSFYMLHNPWTITMGDSEQLRKDADTMDKMKTGMIDIYVAHSGLSKEEVINMMEEETWLTADEAIEKGFATNKKSNLKTIAMYDVSKKGFKNMPKIFTRLEPSTITTKRQFENYLREAGFTERAAVSIASSGFRETSRDLNSQTDSEDIVTAYISSLINVWK